MKKVVLFFIGGLLSTTMAFGQGTGQTTGNGTGNANGSFWRLDGNAGTDVNKPHFIGTLDLMGLAFRTNDIEQMRITVDGDVGIGISVPTAKLHVNGNTQVDGNLSIFLDANVGNRLTTSYFKMPTGAVAGYVLLTDATGEGTWTSPDAFAQTLSWNAATNQLSISSGNTVDLSSLIQALSLNAATNTLSLQKGGSVNLDKYDNGWTYDTGSDLYYNGNVAIGSNTFATGYALSVDGKIASEEVLVDLSGNWPDYVFDKDYKLISLSELAHFVKTEGHLPGIPSAEKVALEGLELGEMQRLLLEKLEELTLHTINQQERIEALQLELEALKTANKQ